MGLEPLFASGKGNFDHSIFVRVICPGDFLAGIGIDEQGSTGEGSKVDAQDIACLLVSFGLGFHGAQCGKAAWQ